MLCQHPLADLVGVKAEQRATHAVREGARPLLGRAQPDENLPPCGDGHPRIEEIVQGFLQEMSVQTDEVLVGPHDMALGSHPVSRSRRRRPRHHFVVRVHGRLRCERPEVLTGNGEHPGRDGQADALFTTPRIGDDGDDGGDGAVSAALRLR